MAFACRQIRQNIGQGGVGGEAFDQAIEAIASGSAAARALYP
jgi:hypothetical protein